MLSVLVSCVSPQVVRIRRSFEIITLLWELVLWFEFLTYSADIISLGVPGVYETYDHPINYYCEY